MQKQDKKKKKGNVKPRGPKEWPLKKGNYQLFVYGILTLIVGYVFLAQGPWDSFMSLTLAPIVLVIGYCVMIPISILYRKKNDKKS